MAQPNPKVTETAESAQMHIVKGVVRQSLGQEKNWNEEFDYVPWIYDVAIEDVVEGITFLRSRGVDMDFILKIYSTSSYDMWEPSRDELTAAGIVNQ